MRPSRPRNRGGGVTPYYSDSFATIFLGDCREILPTLPKVDHIVTDPPYSDQVKCGSRTRNDSVYSGDALVPFSISEDDLNWIFSICSPNRWLIASVDWKHGLRLHQNPPAGMRFVRAGAWVKTNSAPQFTGDRPAPGWEFIAILHSSLTKMRWNGGGGRAVWQTCIENQNGHPTPKPIDLMRRWVSDFSDDGDTILDPFMGSGTTLVAAKQLGRKSIGIELEEKYCEIAARRLQQEYLPLNTETREMVTPGML